jgi:hypothetical protein
VKLHNLLFLLLLALAPPAHAADPVIAAAGDISCDPADGFFNGGPPRQQRSAQRPGPGDPEAAAAHRRLRLAVGAGAGSTFADAGSAGCHNAPDTTDLVLHQGRFQARVSWRDAAGNTGTGRVAAPAADGSGLFWFFSLDNWELLVKVIDGCALNGRHWVFAAATTDVEYTLTVTDSLTGRTARYENPLGRRSPAFTDTEAFATCP